jgi:DGQHR domain-containing protein
MTPEFSFVSGAFELTGCKVPYFLLTMDANEAVQYLHVARELIFDPAEIVLDELFQRDIDDHRVKAEIAPYLMRQGELKFFSALVVVLLPHINNQLRTHYVRSMSSDDGQIDGIAICHAKERRGDGKTNPTIYGTISWEVGHIKAIVVDGQHRYSALKSLADDAPESLVGVSIPVVLLVLDSSMGFKTENPNLLSNVRKIFIDLNRQAKTVSETRNVLLDDRDPAAVLTRALMERKIRPADQTLEQRLSNGTLPLALVDWYSDSVKFDKGIHLTSLLGLYKTITEFLNLPNLDHFDYDNAEDWVNHFKQLDPCLDFASTVINAKRESLPIYLGWRELEKLQQWFEASWGPALVKVLTTIAPYRSLIEHLRRLGLLDGPFECWAAMDRHGKKAFENAHAAGSDFSQLERTISTEKSKDLAFQLVFQKAVLIAFVEMCRVQLSTPDAVPPDEYATTWCKRFNERIGHVSRRRSFWTGFLVRNDDTLNVTRAAERHDICIQLPSEKVLRFAHDYVHELFQFKSARGLEGWKRLQYSYCTSWRSLVRKHLQETTGNYGEGESNMISKFMAKKLVESLELASPDELILKTDASLERLLYDEINGK